MNLQAEETIVIGAGLAGLSCAVRLHESGHRVTILEASDGVGGRVRTDQVGGYLLDRGFQVYLDAYSVAGEFLDLEELDLRPFEPGALVWKKGKLRPLYDVFRRPNEAVRSALQPIGSMRDKLLVAGLRNRLNRKEEEAIWTTPETSTEEYLRKFGFSVAMVDDFFRGFYGGIFLENELQTSSRLFEFTFRLFSKGSATLPARGMQAIPEQLAKRLPKESIQLNTPVRSISGTTVATDRRILDPKRIILAVDGTTAADWIPEIDKPSWKSTTCLYFGAGVAPIQRPLIALRGDREGLINSVCVPNEIQPSYAPKGRSLVSVTLLGDHSSASRLESRILAELSEWFGPEVRTWEHLRTETISRALPMKTSGHVLSLRQEGPIYFCGDHTSSASIEGAILSGLNTADSIIRADA
ncbi:MAG: NAD(P)/FAD-dependent oxidoreductase [Verrucomicrobiota bacterium]